MARFFEFVSRLSVLQDDRGAVVYSGQIAHLTKGRAGLILDCYPGLLEPVKKKRKAAAAVPSKPAAAAEPEADDGGSNSQVDLVELRPAVSALHHSSRRAIARRLGGADDITTAEADEIIAAADDGELTEAAADQLEG